VTTPQSPNLAPLQNATIEQVDLRLAEASLPTYTEALLALDALASAIEGRERSDARNAAIDIVMRASGNQSVMPPIWIQHYGRVNRIPSVHEVVREIYPDAKFEDVATLHGRVIVPAEYVEQVRAAVERVRVMGQIVDVEADPQ
jgi:hypothetical protein